MPRKDGRFKRRTVAVDPIYGNRQLSSFINRIMLDGKKGVAQKIVYTALENLKGKIEDKEAIDVFKQAIKNAMPIVRVKARRIGGATYQVPMEVEPRVSEALAHRWIIGAARKRSGKTMVSKLTNELLDAYNNKGKAVETKEATHKMAEANKAYAHFR
jgi:small subunit ribosomal protein S7